MLNFRDVLIAAGISAAACASHGQNLEVVNTIPPVNPNPNGPYEHLNTDPNAQKLTTLIDEEEQTFSALVGNAIFPAGTVLVGRNGGVAYAPLLGNDLNRTNAPLPNVGSFGGSRTAVVYWDDIGNHREGSGTWGLNRTGVERGIFVIQWRGTLPGDLPAAPLVDFEVQVFNPPIFDAGSGSDVYAQFLYDVIDRGIPNDNGSSATIGVQAEPGAASPVVTDQFSFDTPGAVTNGSVVSVIVRRPCAVDCNGDGFVDFFDYMAFVDCFEGLSCPPGKSCDFNGDGMCDFFDILAFIEAFEQGC